MITLHHTHLMATDIDATIAFWREGFDAEVVYDDVFAGARNVFLRVGAGHLHLYDQPPKILGQGTVHHLGIQTDQLDRLVEHLRALGGVSHRHPPPRHRGLRPGPGPAAHRTLPTQPDAIPPELRDYFALEGPAP
ncbi:VOC family protein [Amycolatopsis sp. NPDC052450]|uniref:VOC family protein n=1 Tax=Amycolatopsis sp. NPDC052450 TaxID=3363937 RepID=UPI0037C95936